MSLAGAVGAMSLGGSVGDIMAISGLAVKVYTAYKDAPGDYRNISDEVKSLDIIINNAGQHFQSTNLSDNKRQEGQEVLRGCQRVLEDLDALIEKYNGLASTSTSQVFKRIKLGTEDIATLRARLTSNTTLLSSFIQSCDSHKLDEIQAQLNSVLGLRRTTSRDSIISFAGSINTKKAYKKFCKGLFEIGVTAEIIRQKEKEIQDMLRPQHPASSNQMDDSTFVEEPNQLLEVENSPDAQTLQVSTMPTENPRPQSRFGWIRPPIDSLVGPLMLAAAETGNTKRLVSTLEFVRNINFADDNQMTALHKAAAKGYKDTVQLLLSKGASTEAIDLLNDTPLHGAARIGHTTIVELLLSKGAPIAAMNENSSTPLHCAASGGHTGTVELLLSKGAPIEAMGEGKRTPLHLAARGGQNSTVELLLSKGALVEAIDRGKHIPLHLAAWNGHTSTVQLLLSKGSSIEAVNKDKETALHLAAWGGQTSTVGLLLSKGASIEVIDKDNNTPLHLAAWSGHTSTVELLLFRGASIEATDFCNETPLHDAARHGHTCTVELLLSKGASAEAMNEHDRTPLDLATLGGHTDTVKLLQNQAAKHVIPGNIQTVSE